MVTIMTLAVLTSRLPFVSARCLRRSLSCYASTVLSDQVFFNNRDLIELEKIAMPLIIRKGHKISLRMSRAGG